MGTGPTGLSMIKNLKEDGFDVTLYERRGQVGGLWAYTENEKWTTALKFTQVISPLVLVVWRRRARSPTTMKYASLIMVVGFYSFVLQLKTLALEWEVRMKDVK